MRILLMFLMLACNMHDSHGQIGNLLERAKQKTKSKVNQRIDQKMDRAIDNSLDKAEKTPKTVSNTVEKNNDADADAAINSKVNTQAGATLASYSKFDFVPGERLIAAEDFSQDAVGDFPAGWNTNGNGELVTTNKTKGKFLMTQKEVVMYPEGIKNLPDNFTLEFDLMSTDEFSYYSGYFIVGFTTAIDIGQDFKRFGRFGEGRIDDGGGFEIGFHPQNAGGKMGITSFYSHHDLKEIVRNDADQDRLMAPERTRTHVSIWRQKNRVRVYMDDKKVWDMPRGLPADLQLNSLYFRNNAVTNATDAYYLSNIRLAVGAPDTRNKLITEGKFVTHGILFDVNSDQIKPNSYGALKDIAQVLSENETVKVKIVGHTDADGDDASNLELSKQRAVAVKQLLISEFKIDANRLQTDGKGETQPLQNNNSSAGKANNRRVEFIKL
ncbi:MAG: OmpA family protein [Chitinophagaceae bacterium]|nr:MAG: OmpA family protein [Chitinophagaceae bacterium]